MSIVPVSPEIEMIEGEIVPADSTQQSNSALLDYYFPNRQRIMSADHLIEMWVNSQNIESKLSQRTYTQIAHELVDWMATTYNIPDLRLCTLGHLQGFVRWLATEKPVRGKQGVRGLSQNAIAKYVSAIRSLWRFGAKPSIGYFAFDIAQELPIKWEDKLAERVLSQKTIWKLEETAKQISERYWVIFNLLFYSGCRVGEIGRGEENEGLFWRQLRLDGECLLLTVKGKGNKSRTVALDPETSTMLLMSRGEARDDDPVFPSHSNRGRGKPITDRAIRKMIEEISAQAGVKFSCHWLRHSHATLAKKRGASDFDIQTQLGHSSPSTTARYIHLSARNSTSHLLRQS